MSRVSGFGLPAVAALLLLGCNSGPLMQPRDAQQSRQFLTGPTSGSVDPEEFEICKYGSSASFDYTITDHNNNNTVTTGQVTLTDGQCQVLVQAGGFGADVTVTERSSTGYALNHVDVTRLANGVTTSSTQTTPTVSGLASGAKTNPQLQGVLAKFYNQVLPPVGSIGDFVWIDANGNGIQDAGEAGIPNVTVTLGGSASATTTTDANGYYLFTGLAAGNYTVTVGTPSGYTPSPSNQGGDPLKDSNGSPASVTLPTNSSSDLSIDFGFVPPPAGSIGDFVWIDANGNGIQDAGEAGIPNVTVTLGGSASATTTTNANGFYLFSGLSAGNYTVTVGTPAGYTPSPSNQGGNPAKDSNGSPASVTLPTNSSSDLTIDFGFVPPSGSIGDFVWIDSNGNGIQDAGEAGIPNVTVVLGGSANATTTTNANGQYLFTGLAAGNYTVSVGTPSGYTPSPSNQGGNPAKDSNGSPASVNLPTNSSNDLTIDFGFVPPPPPSGSIGDFVWLDANGNGIQDAGEVGLAGITVTLSGSASATTTTNANGQYLFTGLSAGSYTVTVGTPIGYNVSPSNQGGNPAKDSNGSPASVTLPTNSSSDLTIDFGFVPQQQVCTPSSNPSNFNGTAIASGSTIWFNAVFKPKGVPTTGGTVNFNSAKITITSGGNKYVVSLPNARITFSPSASSASTTFDIPTNTWITVVPVAYTGNVFLSGVGYAPPGGLPGGANPVTWSGQFTTNMTGFSSQWQWAAAVYTSFGALGSLGVKPIDASNMNPYANSDHAGTPESFKGFVVGGARGGGGSNWTGSYSGTVTPPVCVY